MMDKNDGHMLDNAGQMSINSWHMPTFRELAYANFGVHQWTKMDKLCPSPKTLIIR